MCAITVFHSLLPTWFSMLCHESLLMCCCLSPGAQKFIPVVPYMAQWVQNPTAVNAETQIQSLARELPYFMDVAMIKKRIHFSFHIIYMPHGGTDGVICCDDRIYLHFPVTSTFPLYCRMLYFSGFYLRLR